LTRSVSSSILASQHSSWKNEQLINDIIKYQLQQHAIKAAITHRIKAYENPSLISYESSLPIVSYLLHNIKLDLKIKPTSILTNTYYLHFILGNSIQKTSFGINPTPSDYLEWKNEEINNSIPLNSLQIDYLIIEIIDENPETLEKIIIGKGFTSIDHIVGANVNRNISFKMKIMKVEEGRSRRGSMMSVQRRNSRRRSSTNSRRRRSSTNSRRNSTKRKESIKEVKEEEEVKGKESKKSEKKSEKKVENKFTDEAGEEEGEDGDEDMLEGEEDEEEEFESKEDENLFASLLFDMCASISFTPVIVHPNDPSEQEHNNEIIAEENKCQVINVENNFGKFSIKPSTNNTATSNHFRLVVSELRGDVWNLTKKLTGDYSTSMILGKGNQVKSLKVGSSISSLIHYFF
jgi:hypothetical protein